MISDDETMCPKCGGRLYYYDTVKRIVRTKYGNKYWIKLHRYICTSCRSTHRMLPDFLLPYKHYEKNIIEGFIDGNLSSFILEYEDYPSESIINEWKRTRDQHLCEKSMNICKSDLGNMTNKSNI